MPVAVPVNDYPALIAKAEGDVASADAGAQEALAAQAAKQTELEAAAAPRKQDLQTQRDTAAADVKKSLTDGPKVTPLPENKAQHIDPKQLNETASMMMTLAGLAGLMTRRPMVNALTNMTAAMKGLQAGDEEQYQRSYKEFIDNYKKATDQNAANVKEYDRIIKSKEMSLTEKDRAIRDYAKQVGDEVTTNLKSLTGTATGIDQPGVPTGVAAGVFIFANCATNSFMAPVAAESSFMPALTPDCTSGEAPPSDLRPFVSRFCTACCRIDSPLASICETAFKCMLLLDRPAFW